MIAKQFCCGNLLRRWKNSNFFHVDINNFNCQFTFTFMKRTARRRISHVASNHFIIILRPSQLNSYRKCQRSKKTNIFRCQYWNWFAMFVYRSGSKLLYKKKNNNDRNSNMSEAYFLNCDKENAFLSVCVWVWEVTFTVNKKFNNKWKILLLNLLLSLNMMEYDKKNVYAHEQSFTDAARSLIPHQSMLCLII